MTRVAWEHNATVVVYKGFLAKGEFAIYKSKAEGLGSCFLIEAPNSDLLN